ncbi:gp260 [Sphingomonas phage PAU]|uniref:gp260 n=1 Tax=Sphingomonas phage PAU TaxID=1150991 RepID=UPI000257340A|nr:gp260 [Sphingomonas phage PAU]AFF28258.1 gp260 [Sphingomonas phage PAU]
MNTNYSLPTVPEVKSNVTYTLSESASKGSNFVLLDRKLDERFEIVSVQGNVHMIVSSVKRENGKVYNEIYPALLSNVSSGYEISCLLYNRNNNNLILSSENNYDLISRFMILAEELKSLFKQLSSVTLKLPDDAYKIAVRNGFTGTEQQWLSSLKGKDGISLDPALYVTSIIFNQTVNDLNARIDAIEIPSISMTLNTWDNQRSYSENEFCSKILTNGFELMFKSKTDDNLDNDPISDSTNWECINNSKKVIFDADNTKDETEIIVDSELRLLFGNYPTVNTYEDGIEQMSCIVRREVDVNDDLVKLIIVTNKLNYKIILS